MLVFFQTQIYKILYFFIYLFSFFESKITLFKIKFIPQKNRAIFHYKNKNLLVNNYYYYSNENIVVDYDVKIVIENGENKNYGKIYTNTNFENKNEINGDNFFLNIEVNIIENGVETPYVISLKNPINYYYTNSELFRYEHLHLLMKRIHNINITPDTKYEILIMDKNFNTIKVKNNQCIKFGDDFKLSLYVLGEGYIYTQY